MSNLFLLDVFLKDLVYLILNFYKNNSFYICHSRELKIKSKIKVISNKLKNANKIKIVVKFSIVIFNATGTKIKNSPS